MSVTLHIVDLWQYYVCCARSGVTQCTLFMRPMHMHRSSSCAVYAGAGYTRHCDCISVHLCALSLQNLAEPQSTAGLLLPCQYLCGTILVTPYSILWALRVSRAVPMPFYWPSCSLHFCLLLISLSLLPFFWLVLWGWGLRTDGVLIDLSQPYITNLF